MSSIVTFTCYLQLLILAHFTILLLTSQLVHGKFFSGVFPSATSSSDPCYDEMGNAKRCIPDFVNAAFGREIKVTNKNNPLPCHKVNLKPFIFHVSFHWHIYSIDLCHCLSLTLSLSLFLSFFLFLCVYVSFHPSFHPVFPIHLHTHSHWNRLHLSVEKVQLTFALPAMSQLQVIASVKFVIRKIPNFDIRLPF